MKNKTEVYLILNLVLLIQRVALIQTITLLLRYINL